MGIDLRRLADTAFWVYTAGATTSLALAVYAFVNHGGFPSVSGSREWGLSTWEIAVFVMALTLIFGLFFTVPLLRKANLEQAKLTDHAAKLEVEVVTDPLTGLYNRRYFERALGEYIREFSRIKAPLALLTLDLDHFKSVNDTYGHDVGDIVLKELAKRLQQLTREHDIVARTGGEEFCIVAPFSREDQIRPFAERVCRMIAEMRVDVGQVILRPTVSIGVAATSDGIANAAQLLKVSDERLYEAKDKGRNRVVF
ncbi:GGDEF domain-containing protein [Pseudahrensia aquimaris]|uniref:diguanylate cyclase n=1 Tax=Pseudahrensia aquimaris TaxID=744461 RepID=A0ABW3FHP5_9HYPH